MKFFHSKRTYQVCWGTNNVMRRVYMWNGNILPSIHREW
jgi:hypothetical protein